MNNPMASSSDHSDPESDTRDDSKTWDVYRDLHLLSFLKNGTFSAILDNADKRRIRARAKNYSYDSTHDLVQYIGKRVSTPTPIPRIEDRTQLVATEHVSGGHCGQNATYGRLKSRWFWDGMLTDIRDYVRACNTCLLRVRIPTVPEPMRPVPVPPRPFMKLAIDVCGPFPRTSVMGNGYILAAVCAFSKFMFAKAVPENNAVAMADFLRNDVFPFTGIPETLASDNGPENVNDVMVHLCEQLRVTHKRINPYNPQANGLIERAIGHLKQILSSAVHDHPGDWDLHLPHTLLAMRTNFHSSIGMSPYQLVFGFSPRFVTDPPAPRTDWEDKVSDAELANIYSRAADHSAFLREQAHRSIAAAQARQSAQYNQRHLARTRDLLHPNDLVRLITINPRGLTLAYSGPYRVLSRTNRGNYTISHLNGEQLASSYPLSRLERIEETTDP
jgi:transposase InsO family protein